jgi:AraC-like DNA-binding protein
MEIEISKDEFGFKIFDLRPVKSHLTAVVMLLYLMKICHELSGPELRPLRIHVPWRDGDYNEATNQVMAAPIVFEQPFHGLTFSLSEADRSLPSGNSQLASFQDRLCRDYLHSLDEHRHFPSRVHLKILQALSNSKADIDTVSNSLYMSPRTLQRKLASEGSCFRDILRDVRMELVIEYAQNPDLSASEISYMLGFSGAAQFSTSFKSWFGQTLTNFRQTIENQPP